MAQEYNNNNRGAVWKNDKKDTDKHPDFTGELNVEGVTYWVSAWKRKPDASDKAPALSFCIKAKEGGKGSNPEAKPAKSGFDDFNSDIPF